MCREGITVLSERVLIHPTAIVDSKAELADDVEVGAYSIIGPDVKVDSGTSIGPHVVLKGPTRIGKDNQIFQFASVGEACQDKKYKGEPTELEIGDRNTIREFVTMQRGTVQDRGKTTIGSDNLFMAYVHVGHDCVVGSNTTFANSATLAGHVTVGDGAILGGFTGVHQFCQIGPFSMAGMYSAINKDVPAFVMVQGNMATAHGMNYEGMKRRGYSKALIQQLRHAYKTVYRSGLTLEHAIEELDAFENQSDELQLFIQTLKNSKRGITR